MSKTDHPRIAGTHRVGHAPRSWRDMSRGDDIDYGTPRIRLAVTPAAKRAAIREGLADFEDSHTPSLGECPEDFTPMPEEGTTVNTNSRLAYRAEATGNTSRLAKIASDVRFDAPAKIRRPRVAKHQPRVSDGKTYPVTVRRIGDDA